MVVKKKINVTELEGVAASHEITQLSQKVDRCYSKDKYEDFQSAVRKILTEALDISHIKACIKKHAKEATKEYIEKKGWEDKRFIIPTFIAAVAAIAAIIALFR